MSYKDSRNEIVELIEAKYPLIYVVSDDEIPVIQTFTRIAEQLEDVDVITWNVASGVFCEFGNYGKSGFEKKESNIEEKIANLFELIKNYDGNAFFVLEDFDFVFDEVKHSALGLKDVIQSVTLPISKEKGLKRHLMASNHTKQVIIVSPNQKVPREIEKLMNVVYFGMPGKKEITDVVNLVLELKDITLDKNEKDKIIQSGVGLTEPELINALYKSIAVDESGKPTATKISSIKEQIIRKGGLIEYHSPKIGMNDVGGMEKLQEWVEKRDLAFNNEEVRVARKIPYPKGILLTGVPGCGKSHSVKAIANHLKIPLLRLDMGTLMGKYVGQSEENIRKAIHLAESVSPALLWIDEIEKSFPDPRSGNTHEVSNRLLSYMLTWLQEKESSVFVVATANNIDKLPPELLRKGRFSEIFYVDLPDATGRKQIFDINLRYYDVEQGSVDLDTIIDITAGYSGAEIKDIVDEANFQSAYDNEPLGTHYLIQEIERTTPMSVLMKDKIEAIRSWAEENKVRPAN